MRSIVIIPALNEETNLPLLLEKILSLGSDNLDVLVVDDHSCDRTVPVVEKVSALSLRVKVITNPWAEHGLAYCYKAGFGHALKNGYDTVISMDADGSHDPLEIPRLLLGLENADWVVGSRYVSGGDASGLGGMRYLISKLANFYIGKKLGTKIVDMTSGFNCFKAEVLKRVDFLNIGSKGFVKDISFSIESPMSCAFVHSFDKVVVKLFGGEVALRFETLIEGGHFYNHGEVSSGADRYF